MNTFFSYHKFLVGKVKETGDRTVAGYPKLLLCFANYATPRLMVNYTCPAELWETKHNLSSFLFIEHLHNQSYL